MKVHLVKKQTIEDYAARRPNSRSACALWLTRIKHADWNAPDDIKRTFSAADLLGKGSNRAVFNLGGNNDRLICQYAFGRKAVRLFVCWIGKHADYDALCKRGEQYTRNDF